MAGCIGFGVKRCPNTPKPNPKSRYGAANYCNECRERRVAAEPGYEL